MSYPRTAELLRTHPIISDQIKQPALQVVLSELEAILASDPDIAGDIVEFGCYIGTTSLFMRRLMDAYAITSDVSVAGAATEGGRPQGRQLHVYDSFEGLPPKAAQDMTPVGADFQAGELTVSKKQLMSEFHKARVRMPSVHKGWFSDLSAADVPEQIAFAFLDGDFYESIIDSLRLVWPRLTPGGTICIDDYKRDALPGVERAVRDFFQNKPASIRVAHNIGIIRP